jgi:hypothetical protein
MANPSPKIVEIKFKGGDLDEKTATALLISYIENSENEADRVKSIEILSQMPLHDDKYYRFIEEVLISDSDIAIQGYAASILINNFLERGLEDMDHYIFMNLSNNYLSEARIQSIKEILKKKFLRVSRIKKKTKKK